MIRSIKQYYHQRAAGWCEAVGKVAELAWELSGETHYPGPAVAVILLRGQCLKLLPIARQQFDHVCQLGWYRGN